CTTPCHGRLQRFTTLGERSRILARLRRNETPAELLTRIRGIIIRQDENAAAHDQGSDDRCRDRQRRAIYIPSLLRRFRHQPCSPVAALDPPRPSSYDPLTVAVTSAAIAASPSCSSNCSGASVSRPAASSAVRPAGRRAPARTGPPAAQIGRASCRERVSAAEGAGCRKVR